MNEYELNIQMEGLATVYKQRLNCLSGVSASTFKEISSFLAKSKEFWTPQGIFQGIPKV